MLSAALDKKAGEVSVYDVRELAGYTDYIVVCNGRSDRHVQAIAEGVALALSQRGEKPVGIEGAERGTWVLLDFVDVVVHVFYEGVRDFYDLDGLWSDAPRIHHAPGYEGDEAPYARAAGFGL